MRISEKQLCAFQRCRRRKILCAGKSTEASQPAWMLAPLRSAAWMLLLAGFLLATTKKNSETFCSSFPYRSVTNRKFGNPKRSPETVILSPTRHEPKLFSKLHLPNQHSDSAVSDIGYDNDDTTKGKDHIKKEDDGRSNEYVEILTDYFVTPATNTTRINAGGRGTNSPGSKRGNIQLVAGSGKTFIAWKVMENLLSIEEDKANAKGKSRPGKKKPRIGVYVTPFLNLVDQALNNRDEHEIMATGVYSEKTINEHDKINQRKRRIDTMIVASKSDRAQEKYSTDVNDILDFLTGTGNGDNEESVWKIFTCTYKSLPRLGEALKLFQERAIEEEGEVATNNKKIGVVDFAVFDEAHKMEGLLRSKDNMGNSYGLYDSNIKIQNRLFMSGTPNNFVQNSTLIKCLPTGPRLDGARVFIPKNETKANESTMKIDRKKKKKRIQTFLDESLFGPCLARKSHRESVEQNVTLPISLYGVETGVLRVFDEDQQLGDSMGAEKDRYLPFAILSAFQKLGIKHAVSFHSTNQRARDFTEICREYFAKEMKDNGINEPISLFTMDHTMSPSQRRAILKEAEKSSRSLIANCKLLSMGVDEASLDLVVIADPVLSSVNGRQMIGRVARKAPNKERGYVLVPVPLGENGQSIDKESEAYNVFVNTFQHMVSLDEELRRDVLAVIEKSSKLGRPLKPSEYPQRVSEAFILPSSMRLEQKTQLMDNAIVECSAGFNSSNKDRFLKLLGQFRSREGHCNVPQHHQEDGQNLGYWVQYQRQNKKKGRVDKDLEERLIEMGFVWEPAAHRWDFMYKLLVQYNAREGGTDVPKDHIEDGEKLGWWLESQRKAYRAGKLHEDREQRLTKVISLKSRNLQRWEHMFSLLVEFKAREGHCMVPGDYNPDGQLLGNWLSKQRMSKKKGTIEKEFEERLTSVGFQWDEHSHRWDGMYALLQQYKAREGHCTVQVNHVEEGQKLGLWLYRQRVVRKKGKLDENREKKLTNLGVILDPEMKWNAMYALLEQYKAREGDCTVPPKHVEDGEKLGIWLLNQRRSKMSGLLGADQEAKMNNLGVVWNPRAEKWDKNYALLVKYKKRKGHFSMPRDHVEEGLNLGVWMRDQRRLRRDGRLNANREEQLNKIGFVWNSLADRWNAMYHLLSQYKEREGDCNVPYNHVENGMNLGLWVQNQRRAKEQRKMKPDREKRLNDLGYVWRRS